MQAGACKYVVMEGIVGYIHAQLPLRITISLSFASCCTTAVISSNAVLSNHCHNSAHTHAPQNKLGEAIIERISRAIVQKTPFRCYIFVPLPEELGTTAKVSAVSLAECY